MKKNKFTFPLSFDDIAKLLGKNDNINTEIEGVIMVKQHKTNSKMREAIESNIFKNIFDEWNSERSVVVGQNKLLTSVNVLDYDIKEQSPSINNYIVMSIKAKISIDQDPEYAKEMKEGTQIDTRLKFKK